MMKRILLAIARRLGLRPCVQGSDVDERLKLLPQGGALSAVAPSGGSPCSKAGIVIVSYFGLPYLRQCLESVFKRTAWPDFRVVVVDNGSDAGTLDYLRAEAGRESRLQVVENGSNLGFAAANNIGLRLLGDCDTLVLLNNDTVVPPEWLGKLVHHAARPELGLVGPVTNWTGNEARIDITYRSVAEMEVAARNYAASHAGRLFDISVLAMYCVAFRREVLERAGELDEGYKVGMFEDVDYAEAVRKLGLRVVCCEDVFVHHYGMASFSKLDPAEYQRLFEQNRAYFEKKWGHPWRPHAQRKPNAGRR
jgi:GT2 family glycosyltransferase